ncbi:uncharacterized protein LOC111392952 [Olea europaea var. sylvestris]|uniref:uncharacterized protein LOC111392952 n=1 Tax=Olea europaea var. sylvestris TaxID=158386 RepID=UPI000C1D301D|nr:uncharacterized protein LOC111392952 [Olea europaea var. sylvestris]
MKLNPKKCVFGVASRKFLGFMITHRGIEANPDKIQALATMELPRTKKEVQKLMGRVAALNRFMSRAADRSFPFFKVLRGSQSFEWNEECEKAFQELKQTLTSLPILTKSEPGDTLLLYLAVSQNAVSGVLVKEVNRAQQPIYYISKVLLDAETRYTLAEQLALALIVATRKLHQYFQSHPIMAIELGEFDLEFKPCLSIKAQGLANFIAKLIPRPRGPDESSSTTTNVLANFHGWRSNSLGSGVGVIITGPDMLIDIQCALKFKFEATNNEVEYKAIIIAMELVINLELESIKIFSDSQLVRCEIVKIARADNLKADAISRLVFMEVDGLDRAIHIRLVTETNINPTIEVMDIDHESSWMDPIVDFITNDNLPEDPQAARNDRLKAPRYCIIDGVLFCRSLTLLYLRCFKPSVSSQALAKVHEGVCENHQGARALALKLIRYGYYWPTMKKDAVEYVKECDKCPRFGIPKVLITNYSRQLDNVQFKDFCSNLGVDHCLTSISHPRSNVLAEVTNRIILQDLRTRIGDVRGSWSDELPSILWTYRISHRTITVEIPFMLAFKIEAIIPIEIRLPSRRRLNLEEAGHTTEHLDLLEEVCDQAALRMVSYQDRTTKHFNRKVRPRRFKVRDLVLRRAKAAGHAPGKLGPVWERPFEVIRRLPGGEFSLKDTSKRPLPRS